MSCITEILKVKGSDPIMKAIGEDGKPWIVVEGGGNYKDYEYLIVLNQHGHRCGYVAIPPGHKYDSTPLEKREFLGTIINDHYYNYSDLDIDCHGGLTFMERDHVLKDKLSIPCKDFWIGFDCGHYMDKPDIDCVKEYYGEEHYNDKKSFFDCMSYGSVRLYGYVEQECKNIIDQLITIQEAA